MKLIADDPLSLKTHHLSFQMKGLGGEDSSGEGGRWKVGGGGGGMRNLTQT